MTLLPALTLIACIASAFIAYACIIVGSRADAADQARQERANRHKSIPAGVSPPDRSRAVNQRIGGPASCFTNERI